MSEFIFDRRLWELIVIVLACIFGYISYWAFKQDHPEGTVSDWLKDFYNSLFKYPGSYRYLVDVSKREDWTEEQIRHRLWKLRYKKQHKKLTGEGVDEAIWLLDQTLRKKFSAPVGEPDKASGADRIQLLLEECEAELKKLEKGTDIYEHTKDMYDQKIGRIKEEL